MLIFSAHADTNFAMHSLERDPDGSIRGHLDNFLGVHAMMLAYFSGRLNMDWVRIELTWGEEEGLLGAKEVSESLKESDTVIVVDVTSTPTEGDLVFEKCRREELQEFLLAALDGIDADIYEDCPDPVADSDETDVYSEDVEFTTFLGIPCYGGDYNEGPVETHQDYLNAAVEAICRIAEQYPQFCEANGLEIY